MRILGREGMAEDYRFDTNSRRVENRDELHAEIERAADERELDIRGRRSVHGAAFCHGSPDRKPE